MAVEGRVVRRKSRACGADGETCERIKERGTGGWPVELACATDAQSEQRLRQKGKVKAGRYVLYLSDRLRADWGTRATVEADG